MAENDSSDVSQRLNDNLVVIHREISEMKDVLRELTKAISHLAVVDERVGHLTSSVASISATIVTLEVRIRTLELASPANSKTNAWVDRAVIGAVCVLLMFIAKKVGLI